MLTKGEFFYNPLDIAMYIIKYCNEKELEITPLRLQKLLFFVHIELLVFTKKKSYIEANFYTSNYGVYEKNTLEEYSFGNKNIPLKEYYGKIIFNDEIGNIEYAKRYLSDVQISDRDILLINGVIERYSKVSTIDMIKKMSKTSILSINKNKQPLDNEELYKYYSKKIKL